jgi:hypothetical protein
MKKTTVLAIAGVSLAFWACAKTALLQDEAVFKGKTGVIGVFRQPAFYCSEATPHYMKLGDSTFVVKPTWSTEQDNVFFAPLKPGPATLYSYSYDCGENENKFVLDTTAANKGASGLIIPEQGLCKIVISFVQGDKLFMHDDVLIDEEFKKADVAVKASDIPYCEVLKGDGTKLSFANRDSLLREQFKAAVEAAKDGGCEQVRPLVVIDSTSDKVTWNGEKDKVLMVAAHATPDLYENGMPVTIDGEMRVYSDREILDWYKMTGKSVRNWPLRLRQLLGLPRDAKITHFTTFWVDPKNMIRPAYTPDITSSEMACRFEEDDDSQLDSLGMWLRNWFDKAWSTNYKSEGGYPWTRLGYTYDWGADGIDKYGLSEFLLMNESKVVVQTTKDLKSFVRWLGDRR